LWQLLGIMLVDLGGFLPLLLCVRSVRGACDGMHVELW